MLIHARHVAILRDTNPAIWSPVAPAEYTTEKVLHPQRLFPRANLVPCLRFVRRMKTTCIHEGNPLKADTASTASEYSKLEVDTPPVLAVVFIQEEKGLPEGAATPGERLRHFVGRLLRSLHPLGTVVFSVPRPWLLHGSRIRGEIHYDDDDDDDRIINV